MNSGLPFNLDDLVHQRVIESNRVEFKATWNDVIEEAVVRTACAFANDLLNLNGGYIVLGVEEADGHPVLPPRGLGGLNLDRLQMKIRVACKRIEPDYLPIIFPEIYEDRPLLVLFCPGGDNRAYQAPSKGGGKAFFVRQGPQSVEAQGDTLRRLMELAGKIPFDDRRSLEGRVIDLSPTLVRRFLDAVGSKLAEAPIPDADLYRRLRIVVPVNGHEAPRNIGLLFFSDDPDRFFPGARIEVVRFPDEAGGNLIGEAVFRGPLPEQIRACLDYVNGMAGMMIEKVAHQPESIRTLAYPPEAVREALINAIYHRGYDGPPEPVKVYLYPDRLRIISYPGPLPGIRPEHFLPGAEFPAVPARNRRIGDFFKELHLAETRGTGIPKILHTMEENGSPPPEFSFDEGRTYFQTTLPIHRRIAQQTARELWQAGKQQPAVELLRRAFSRQPGFVDLAQQLIEYELSLKQGDRALKAMQEFAQHMEIDEYRLGQAWPFLQVARWFLDAEQREAALEILTGMPPVTMLPSAHLEYAILVSKAGDLDRAYEHFEEVYHIAPEAPYVLSNFAPVKMEMAERFIGGAREQLLCEAAEMLQNAIAEREKLLRESHGSGDPQGLAWDWFQLARVRERLRMPPTEITRAYQEALTLLPEEPAFLATYRQWRQRSGRSR